MIMGELIHEDIFQDNDKTAIRIIHPIKSNLQPKQKIHDIIKELVFSSA